MSIEITQHRPFAIKPLNGDAPEVLKQAHLLDIKYWLGGGTVLGLYRDGDFIAGDTDIDIEVEGYGGVDKYLLKTFEHMDLIRTVCHIDKPMQLAFICKEVIFDIYVLWREGESMVNHNDMGTMETPAHFYEDLAILDTQYGKYPCPNPFDDYLAIRYGADWQTPRKHKGLYTHAI
jgi:hypothetical protein